MAPLSGMVILDGLFADGLLRRLPVAVCDLDGSSTSRELIRRVDALPSARVAALLASPDEGRDAIRRGEVFAVLVIPRHFERDLLRRRPVQAIAYIDGQHMPVGSVLRRDLVDLGTAGWKLAFTDTLRRSGVPPVQADAARQNSPGECVITSGTSDCTRCKKNAKAGHVPAFFTV